MSWIQSSFQWAEGLYSRMFADWLHINFIVRTVLLLLMLWLIIYVAALIFKLVIGPFVAFVFVNLLLRPWNFLFVETVQEWIYIRHHSNGSPRFSNMYMRLTDRAKRNRAVLSGSQEAKAARRGRIRRLGTQMMITAGVIAAMWVVAFGINQEYAVPAWAASSYTGEENGPEDYNAPPGNEGADEDGDAENDEITSYYEEYNPGMVRPRRFPEGVQLSFILTYEARDGARLRSGPGTADTVVIEMLYGDEILEYLGYYTADAYVDTLYWIHVRSQAGVVGYIASHLVEVVDGAS